MVWYNWSLSEMISYHKKNGVLYPQIEPFPTPNWSSRGLPVSLHVEKGMYCNWPFSSEIYNRHSKQSPPSVLFFFSLSWDIPFPSTPFSKSRESHITKEILDRKMVGHTCSPCSLENISSASPFSLQTGGGRKKPPKKGGKFHMVRFRQLTGMAPPNA